MLSFVTRWITRLLNFLLPPRDRLEFLNLLDPEREEDWKT